MWENNYFLRILCLNYFSLISLLSHNFSTLISQFLRLVIERTSQWWIPTIKIINKIKKKRSGDFYRNYGISGDLYFQAFSARGLICIPPFCQKEWMGRIRFIYLFIYVIKKVYREINLVNQIDIDWEIEFVNETDSSKF